MPFNIASYAIFTQMVAQCVNMVPDTFIWTAGDTHIYTNQVEGTLEQLARVPGTFPIMKLNPERRCIDDFVEADFELVDYDPQGPIDFGPVAV